MAFQPPTPLENLVSFGHMDYMDYTRYNNEERRINYLKRVSNIKGNWKNDPYSPNQQ